MSLMLINILLLHPKHNKSVFPPATLVIHILPHQALPSDAKQDMAKGSTVVK